MDSKVEKSQNWRKISYTLTTFEAQLRIWSRTIFKGRWKSLYGEEWNEDESNCDEKVESLIGILGLEIVKTINVVQMKALNSGKIKEWDLSTLSKILQKVKTPSNEQHDNENKIIQSCVQIRDNFMANPHHPNKIIPNEDFNQYSSKLDLLAFQFEISCLDPNDSSVIIEKYTKLKNEANVLYENDEYEKAIKLYSKALLLPNLSNDQIGILYSNRSISYLKLKNDGMTKLAFSDAKSCEKFRPNWFKSHWRIAEAQMMLRNFPYALISYNKALCLEPTNNILRKARDFCKNVIYLREISYDIFYDNMSDSEFSKMLDDYEKNGKMNAAQRNLLLGHQHCGGIKMEKNYEKAVKHYKMAAQEGNAEALYHLALLKIKGHGCKVNITEGFKILEKAANDTTRLPNGAPAIGIAEAQCELGRAYQYGIGVPQSLQTAVIWHEKAANNGYEAAAKEITSILLQLNSKSKLSKDAKNEDQNKNEEFKSDLGYLTNRKRIELIKRARKYSQYCRTYEKFKSEGFWIDDNHACIPFQMVRVSTTIPPQISKSPTELKYIHLIDMDQTKEMIYNGTKINLTVIDDPNLFKNDLDTWTIYVVIQDDLFDVQLLSVVFNFCPNIISNEGIEKYFGFGCKFTLINPCIRIDDDGRPLLRIDEFKSINFKNNENVLSQKLCHYCFAENSESSCSKCGKNYCSKECQMNDWKILKHKFVCLK